MFILGSKQPKLYLLNLEMAIISRQPDGIISLFFNPMSSPVAVIHLHPRQPNKAIKSANDSFLWVIATNRPTMAAGAHPIAGSGFRSLIVSTDVTKVMCEHEQKRTCRRRLRLNRRAITKRWHVSCRGWKTVASAASPYHHHVHQGHWLQRRHTETLWRQPLHWQIPLQRPWEGFHVCSLLWQHSMFEFLMCRNGNQVQSEHSVSLKSCTSVGPLLVFIKLWI